jgi:hypothetical protein
VATPDQHFQAARKFQKYYSEALRHVGVRVPAPRLGDTCNDYRRETLRNLKRTFLPEVHPLYGVQYRGLKSDVLPIFESQLLKACVTEANNPAQVPAGELKKIERHDAYGQVKFIDFIGQTSFVKSPEYGFRPGRRVTGFRTPLDDRGQSINWNRVP